MQLRKDPETMPPDSFTIVTAGAAYLDIDAYACAVAMAELLCLQGHRAIAYSKAPCDYSVLPAFQTGEKVKRALPTDFQPEKAKYVLVDVSDPGFLEKSILPEQVVSVYDHHVGFEAYWSGRIGENACIAFIGAAATLVYRKWKQAGLTDKMQQDTARLLVAAILDNTLNLTSSVTTQEDIDAFHDLCAAACVDKAWCAAYFADVQKSVEADLENALLSDVKTLRNHPVLPEHVGQIAVWHVGHMLQKIEDIQACFRGRYDHWLLNIIDIQNNCSYFVCNDGERQQKMAQAFHVCFEGNVAKAPVSYLRKELIKKTMPLG